MEKISIKLEEGSFNDKEFFNDNYCVIIYLNDIEIGDIIGFVTEDDIHLELFHIHEKYRGKGYGSIALKQLLDICKSLGIKYMHGDCKNSLINFYKKFGADFKPREEDDKTYLNNRFYIDL